MMILDETSQATALHRKQLTLFYNSIKHIGNRLRIPIIIGGTEAAATASRMNRNWRTGLTSRC